MTGDPLIDQKEQAEAEVGAEERFADLFDVRRVIAGLFGVYGLILLVLGFFASEDDIARGQGVNVNLAVGIALLIVAALFIVWALRSPVGAELAESGGERREPSEAPAPRGTDAAALPASRRPGTGGRSGGTRGGGTPKP